jgi:hypothetical protein
MELSPGSVQDKRDGDGNVGNRGATKGGWSGDPENDSEDELPPLVSDSDSEDESLKVALYGRSPPLNTRPYWVIIRRKASIDEEMRLSQGPVQDKHDGDGDHHSRSAGRQASTETSGPLQSASEEGVRNYKTPPFESVQLGEARSPSPGSSTLATPAVDSRSRQMAARSGPSRLITHETLRRKRHPQM